MKDKQDFGIGVITLAGFFLIAAGVLYSSYQIINLEGITTCRNSFQKYETNGISSQMWELVSQDCNSVFSQKGTHLRIGSLISALIGIFFAIRGIYFLLRRK